MSTPETKIAYLDNILLQMVDISDHFEKAIARYEYPYLDGADLEDMGQKAHTNKIRCFFFDNAGQQTYDDHITLLEYLKSKSDFVFLHPSYGALEVKIDSIDVRQDDRLRTAEVDLALVEHGIEAITATPTSAVDAESEGSFSQGEDEQVAAIVLDMAGSGLDISFLYNAALPLLSQVTGVASRARSYAQQIDAAIGYLEAFEGQIAQPVNSLVATLSYATSLPGRILGTMDQCVERVARAYDGIDSFPARFLSSVQFGLAALQTSLASFLPADRYGAQSMIQKHLSIAASRRLALETAYVYAADQAARLVLQGQGSSATFDAMGNYAPSSPPDVDPLDVNELENSLAASRTLLQASISVARSMYSLKDMALQLLSYVSGAKATAEQTVTILVDGPVPLHVICLQYGLPYSDAGRILALNPGLRNPTFTSGPLQIYAAPGGAA